MINLDGASDAIQVVTAQAVSVDCHASYVDKNLLVFTPGRDNTAITTAATTTVVSAPGSNIQRNVKALVIRNKHATLSVDVTVNHVGDVTVELEKRTLAPGTALVYEEGRGFDVTSSPSIVSHQVFVSGSGTYTKPTGVKAIKVECVGGGGAGGSCLNAATNSSAAGGGGAGGYSCVVVQSPAASYPYVVGAGGTPGAVGNNPGGPGGDTTFGSASICTGKGGAGGLGDTVAVIHVGGLGGAGGLASGGVGDVKAEGQAGGGGVALAAAQALSGRGGSSVYGGGAVARKNGTGAGIASAAFGGGGSGGAIISGGASQQGGAGAPGLILVTEYR